MVDDWREIWRGVRGQECGETPPGGIDHRVGGALRMTRPLGTLRQMFVGHALRIGTIRAPKTRRKPGSMAGKHARGHGARVQQAEH